MDIATTDERTELTPVDKKRKLHEKQKATLDGFLERNAITQQQYNKSLGDLTEKMGYRQYSGIRRIQSINMENMVARYQAWMDENNVHGNIFIDGIIDETVFKAPENGFRPLFIMREVHDTSEKNSLVYDIRTTDIKEGRAPTWRRLATLALGLYSEFSGHEAIYELLPFEDNGSGMNCNPSYRDIIRRIAVINLKKISGGPTSDSTESKECGQYMYHAEHFSELLLNQIHSINPNLIICCGSGLQSTCEENLFSNKESSFAVSDIPNRLSNGCYLSEVYHPSFGAYRRKNYENEFRRYREFLQT